MIYVVIEKQYIKTDKQIFQKTFIKVIIDPNTYNFCVK